MTGSGSQPQELSGGSGDQMPITGLRQQSCLKILGCVSFLLKNIAVTLEEGMCVAGGVIWPYSLGSFRPYYLGTIAWACGGRVVMVGAHDGGGLFTLG